MAMKKEKKQIYIEIPELNIGYLPIRLTGKSILVMKSMRGLGPQFKSERGVIERDENGDVIEADKIEPGSRAKQKGKKYDPVLAFENARHKIDDKTDGIPAGRLRMACITAATTFVGDVTKTQVRGAIFVIPDIHGRSNNLIPIEHSNKVPIMREDMVRIGSKIRSEGAPDLTWRPEYRNWSIPLIAQFEASIISPGSILNLFKRAGFHVGIGEWRPEKSGEWGRFDAVIDQSIMKTFNKNKGKLLKMGGLVFD